MYVLFFTDLIITLLLMVAFYAVWKERNNFFSIRPLLPAIILLSVGRLFDMFVEYPSIRLASYFGQTVESIELIISVISNIIDAVGILLLIFGFVKIIKFQKEEKQLIKNLETFLPICSNCKKYRTDDDDWVPIEKYLIENGTPHLTHSICPECMAKLYTPYFDKKKKLV